MPSEIHDQVVLNQNSNTMHPIRRLFSFSTKKPWVTWLAISACIIVYLGLAVKNDYSSWETLSKWGCLPANSVWDGAYWGLFTSVFVHFALWHLVFNLYWLWALGGTLERTIGSFHYLVFFVFSAFVSSTFQLSLSDSAGIGASGVVYSIFGFMLIGRNRFPQFKQILTPQIVNIFLIWLIGCLFVTHFKIWEVGNAAHISGLVFGGVVAAYFFCITSRFLTIPILLFMVVFPTITMFWCPWSITWLSLKARNTQIKRKFDEAIDLYSQVIKLDNTNGWAYYNRGKLFEYLEKPDQAKTDLELAKKLGFQVDENK
jgi:rhomboid protease GluP